MIEFIIEHPIPVIAGMCFLLYNLITKIEKKKCPKCQSFVSKTAKKCPKCTADI